MPLKDRALNLLALLEGYGIGNLPIVFVTHSLGGLVTKQMLQTAFNQPHYRRFAQNTKGVVFLATPHAGSNKATWLDNLLGLLGTTDAVKDLRHHSDELWELNAWYRNNVADLGIRTSVFRETQLYKGLLIVDAQSSDPGLPGVPVTPVDRHHCNICTFPSREFPYWNIRDFIGSCAAPADNPAPPAPGPIRNRAELLLETYFANDGEDARRGFFNGAFAGAQRSPIGDLTFSGSAKTFAASAVDRLIAFQCSDPGRHALARLIEHMAAKGGYQQNPDYEELPRELNALCTRR